MTENQKHWASVLIGTGLATFVTVLAFALVDYITGWDLFKTEAQASSFSHQWRYQRQ